MRVALVTRGVCVHLLVALTGTLLALLAFLVTLWAVTA